jgi:hypothetical protein
MAERTPDWVHMVIVITGTETTNRETMVSHQLVQIESVVTVKRSASPPQRFSILHAKFSRQSAPVPGLFTTSINEAMHVLPQ